MADLRFSTAVMEAVGGPINSLMANTTHPFVTSSKFHWNFGINKNIIIYKGAKPSKATIASISVAPFNYNLSNILINFDVTSGVSTFATYHIPTQKLSMTQLIANATAAGTATHFIAWPVAGTSNPTSPPALICGDVSLAGGGGDLILNGGSLSIVTGQSYSCKLEIFIPYNYTY